MPPATASLHAGPLPPPPRLAFAIAWVVFWVLLGTVALHDHWRAGKAGLWQPLFWEGSSCLVATLLLWWLWRDVPRLDRLLLQPWRWFGAALLRLPPAALAFVAGTYALRHAVYAAFGLVYRHDPWLSVFVYETLKFSMFYGLFVAVFFGMRSYAAMQSQALRAERERSLARQAQLLQLAQQIEPHFLFNALNTIAATVHEDPDLADSLITRLAALLRAATDMAREPVRSVADELMLLEAYGEIMCRRFAGRVSLRFEIDAQARGCRVPTLALQPLLENAFRHGVEAHPGQANIVVRAARHGERLELTVEDDIGELDALAPEGVGLSNLRQRLAAAFGDAASLRLEALAPRGVRARIELPCGC